MRNVIFCMIFLMSIYACNDSVDPNYNTEYVIFGTYFGECSGENCVQVYKIEIINLYKDANHRYPGDGPHDFILQPKEKSKLALGIRTEFPEKLFSEKEGRIGNPDVVDQGGVFLEVKKKGKIKKWYIDLDTNNVPEYLRTYVANIKTTIDAMRD